MKGIELLSEQIINNGVGGYRCCPAANIRPYCPHLRILVIAKIGTATVELVIQ